jgi:hypothetical protein
VNFGVTSDLDASRAPRLRGCQVINDESDMWVLLDVAKLLALGETVAANVDRVVIGVVAKTNRHYVRPAARGCSETTQAL